MSPLDAEKIRGALGNRIIGHEIITLNETTSTNDAILERAAFKAEKPDNLAPEGLVIFAEQQTAGRGQRAKSWESAKGKGLWFSILLRPRIDLSESARLTEWAAQTIAKTIGDQLSITPTIKPPN